MAIPTINFAGYVYNDAGTAVANAAVNLFAKNSTTTSLASDTTDEDGRWDINYTTANTVGLDIQIQSGESYRRIKYDDKIHLAEVDTAVLNVRGIENTAAAMFFYADEGEDAGDRWKFNAANGGVFTILNDASGQASYVAHVTITPNSTVANSTVAVAGNLTVGNALTVTGTTTLNGNLVLGDAAADTLTVGATLLGASPLTFEGGTADGHETTFAITDPTADRTITFPNATGTVILGGDVTAIDSLLATDIKIGEDDQTKVDFETADEIHFYAANVEQVYVADNIFGPQSDSDVDLGTTGVRWKDAFVDSITVTGAITGVTIDASTDFTIGDTVITDGVVTDSTGLQLVANLDIAGTVDISGDLTLSAGSDGALVFGTA